MKRLKVLACLIGLATLSSGLMADSVSGDFWSSWHSIGFKTYGSGSEGIRGITSLDGNGNGILDKDHRVYAQRHDVAHVTQLVYDTPEYELFTYTESNEGIIHMNEEDLDFYTDVNGTVGVAVFADQNSSNNGEVGTGMALFLKRGSGFTPSTVAGEYWLVGHEAYYENNSTGSAALRASVELFENGTGTYNITYQVSAYRDDSNGAIGTENGDLNNSSFDYTVSDDGNLTIVDENVSMYISADGNSATRLIEYEEDDDGYVSISRGILVKKGSGLSTSSLKGKFWYFMQKVGFYNAEDDLETAGIEQGTVEFDGNGNCIVHGSIAPERAVRNDDSNTTTLEVGHRPPDGSCTYSVSADGIVTLDGGQSYYMSANGNMGIGVDSYGNDHEATTELSVFIKKKSSSNASLPSIIMYLLN